MFCVIMKLFLPVRMGGSDAGGKSGRVGYDFSAPGPVPTLGRVGLRLRFGTGPDPSASLLSNVNVADVEVCGLKSAQQNDHCDYEYVMVNAIVTNLLLKTFPHASW